MGKMNITIERIDDCKEIRDYITEKYYQSVENSDYYSKLYKDNIRRRKLSFNVVKYAYYSICKYQNFKGKYYYYASGTTNYLYRHVVNFDEKTKMGDYEYRHEKGECNEERCVEFSLNPKQMMEYSDSKIYGVRENVMWAIDNDYYEGWEKLKKITTLDAFPKDYTNDSILYNIINELNHEYRRDVSGNKELKQIGHKLAENHGYKDEIIEQKRFHRLDIASFDIKEVIIKICPIYDITVNGINNHEVIISKAGASDVKNSKKDLIAMKKTFKIYSYTPGQKEFCVGAKGEEALKYKLKFNILRLACLLLFNSSLILFILDAIKVFKLPIKSIHYMASCVLMASVGFFSFILSIDPNRGNIIERYNDFKKIYFLRIVASIVLITLPLILGYANVF